MLMVGRRAHGRAEPSVRMTAMCDCHDDASAHCSRGTEGAEEPNVPYARGHRMGRTSFS